MTTNQAHEGAGVGPREITIALGRSNLEQDWTNKQRMPFNQFTGMFTSPRVGQKNGSCYCPAVFPGKLRRKDLAQQIDIAVLDSDCGYTADEIIAAVKAKGWEAIVHSTYSHGKPETPVACSAYDKWREANGRDDPESYMLEKKGYLQRVVVGAKITGKVDKDCIVAHQPCPKYRVVLPLSRPWVAGEYADQNTANAVWKARILALAAALGLHSDQSCTDTSRLFYFPTIKTADQPFTFKHVEGGPCDIWGLPAVSAPEPRRDARRAPRKSQPSHGHAEPGATESLASPPAEAPTRAGDQFDLRAARDINGRPIDLIAWSVQCGPRFEIVKALKAKEKAKKLEIFGRRRSGVKHHIVCPFNDEHTASDDRTGTYVVNASEIGKAGLPGISDTFSINCMHDACANRDRLEFIAKMLEQGSLTVADLEDGKFMAGRPEDIPEWPGPMHPLAEARAVARDKLEEFAAYSRRWNTARGAHETKLAMHVFSGLASPGTTFGRIDVGVGKTEAAIKSQIAEASYAAQYGESAVFAVPMHKLSGELKDRIERTVKRTGLPVTVAVYRGRNQEDPDAPEPAPGEHRIQMCRRPEVGEELTKSLEGQDKACRTAGGDLCSSHGICGTKRMEATKADIWIVPHALLTMGRPKMIGRPRVVVVDESFRGSAIQGMDPPARIASFDDIGRNRPVSGKGGIVDYEKTAELSQIMRAIAKVVASAPDGTIEIQGFIDAGIDHRVAAKAVRLLYMTRARIAHSAAWPDQKIKSAARKAQKINGSLPQVIRLAKILAHHLRDGTAFLPGIRVEREIEGRGGVTYDAVRLRWLDTIDRSWEAPTLHLDATGRRETVAALFNPINKVIDVSVKIQHAYIRQILWSGAKVLWQQPDDRAEEPEVDSQEAATKAANAQSRANNVKRILRHVVAHAFQYRGQGGWVESKDGRRHWIDVLVICQSDLEKQLVPHLPPNAATLHFGNLVGIDAYGSVAYCVVIGRTMASSAEVELTTELIYRKRVLSINGGNYPRRQAAVRLYGRERGPTIRTPYHPDPLVEAVRWEIAEGAVVQAVGRARAANRRPGNPVHIDIIGDLILPIEVDLVLEWDQAQSEADILTLAAKGFILGHGSDTAEWARGLHREAWPNARAFRDWTRRCGRHVAQSLIGIPQPGTLHQAPSVAKSNRESFPLENATSEGVTGEPSPRPRPQSVYRTFAVFVGRRALANKTGRPQVIAIDLAQHRDPLATLRKLVGSIASLQILYLPLEAALAALRSSRGDIVNLETAIRLFAMRDVEATMDASSNYSPIVGRYFYALKRPMTLPHGWKVGAALSDDVAAQARAIIDELRLHAGPGTLDAVIEAAAAIDPTAREWLPPLIADWRRARTKSVPRPVPSDGRLHVRTSTIWYWVDDQGEVHDGRPPTTRREKEYALRLAELRFFKLRPIRQGGGEERLQWIDLRTGQPAQPPRVPRIMRIVDNGMERWHVIEALPLDAQTDAERMANAMVSEIGDGTE